MSLHPATDQFLKVLIVEDDIIIGTLIESHLKDAGHQVIDIIHNGDRALDVIHNQQPDLILLDINIEGTKDGIDVGMIIKEKYDIPFIFLTALSDVDTLERAKIAEPSGYVVKPYKASDLYSSITIGMYNYQSKQRKTQLTPQQVNQLALDPLSDREFSLLKDISDGLTNAQIAEKQFLSLSTVKWHLQNVYSKLGVKNRTSAVKKVLATSD